MPLFEVAILEKPTKKQEEEGHPERLVFGPRAVVARDEQSAAIAAIRSEAGTVEFDSTRSEVLVRPFVGR